MSYQADHMAWQQRVGLELNAHKRNLDKVLNQGSQFGANQQLYDLYQSIISESQKANSASGSRKSASAFSQFSKHLVTYGGRQQRVQNPVLATGPETQVSFYPRPMTRDMDAISTASGAYVGKRSTNRPQQRQMSAQSRTVKLTPAAKAFYPEEYYKRVGYQKSEASSHARVDALGQRVRDRFNEDAVSEYSKQQQRPSGGLHHRTLKQLKNAHRTGGPASQTGSVFSQGRRSMAPSQAAVSQATLAKLEQARAAASKEADVQSVITLDRLKKFNEVNGTYAGNVIDEIQAREAAANGEFQDEQEVAANGEDNYGLQGETAEEQELREEEKDDVLSQQMAAASLVSKQSRRSTATSKTYISKLEKQLEAEKQARLKLELEVEDMKKINAEISSKLGLSNPSVNLASGKDKQ